MLCCRFSLSDLTQLGTGATGPATLATAFPQKKTWWAKKITNDVYTGGRPTERQIRYLYEEGFKTIVTVFDFDADGKFGDLTQPKTAEEKAMAEAYGDFTILSPPATWSPTDGSIISDATNLAKVLETAAKPVYVHCGTGMVGTLLSSIAVHGKDLAKILAVEEQFQFGWLGNAAIVKALKTHTGGDVQAAAGLAGPWTKYWWSKRLTDTLGIAGQIWKGTLPKIKEAGYTAELSPHMARSLMRC